ncbi:MULTISPECIES: DUF768 domain-containing protein [unclassified Mesorhizobium]|uniref:DUF768 domain-containing protein n=1 Tax=unclassified Mesorhizobium TaxID=325217 RepID=UPI0003CE414E|nr:DUF768 domain-containing protein [Mesorhizobium sp. LNJC403B00]ESX91753.1 hypothetical protein X754_21815 [Mesorhizobium sp. LNJC403B00]
MSKPAVLFLNQWIKKHDLSDAGAPKERAEIEQLAKRLIADAEAEGIAESELTEAFDDKEVDSLYRTLLDVNSGIPK